MPALTSAGSNVHLWKSALTTKKHQIPLPASAHELAKLADIPIEVAEAATVSEANTALHRAWDRLKDRQRESVNL